GETILLEVRSERIDCECMGHPRSLPELSLIRGTNGWIYTPAHATAGLRPPLMLKTVMRTEWKSDRAWPKD
ncbi:MAG: hypothetical protein LC674_02965, partial [Actinobacteria bacterium]|nr:hypothetical protein [Actinomycetota bacterium]